MVNYLDVNSSINPEEISVVIRDFIKTYVENSECKGVVLGLSGGVDSALTAILCKDALGKKNTNCIFLPDNTTPEIDFKHQGLIVKEFNLLCEKKDITSLVEFTERNCVIKPNEIALANIKSRLRMTLIFEYANMTDSLVCGCSNKSELLLGYFTKYGDGGADILPIGDLYKTQVFELARFFRIPDNVISKPPTAGLIKEQTDEKDLKLNYYDLDRILIGLEQKKRIIDIERVVNIKKSEIERIKNMRINSQHKRRTALIPKIGVRTPGLDWSSPILKG